MGKVINKSLRLTELAASNCDAMAAQKKWSFNQTVNELLENLKLVVEPKKPAKAKVKTAKSTRKTKWADGYILTDRMHCAAMAYWEKQRRPDLQTDVEFEKFKAYCKSHGSKYDDWDAAWQTRYVNAVPYNKPPQVKSNGKRKQTSSDRLQEQAENLFGGRQREGSGTTMDQDGTVIPQSMGE